ncbi:MAG: hypothetical protein KJS87_07140 [Alphaproteobacteria bacterium]|nr:hypothetical protein [Alphaproteobacteria bacterium]
MSKIPVFATVSRTYGFLLGDIATVLQVAWLPMAVAAGLNFYYGQSLNPAEIVKGGPEAAMQASALSFGIGIASMVASLMVTVGLLRVVMYGQRPAAPFYLWFGMAELRLLLAYTLLGIAFIAAILAFALVMGILGAAVASTPAAPLVAVAAGAFVIAMFWALIRLTLIPAVIVAENNLGVERAWALSGGNALRLLAILILTYLPFAVIMVFITFTMVGLPFPDFAGLGGDSMDAKAIEQAVQAWQKSFMDTMYANWLTISILNFISSIVSAVLYAGIAGNAYMAVAGDQSHAE